MSSLLVFNTVYRLEIQSVMLVFSAPLVNYRPSNLLSGSPTPSPPPFPVRISAGNVFIQCVTTGEVEGIGGIRHLPPSIFTGQFLGKADI